LGSERGVRVGIQPFDSSSRLQQLLQLIAVEAHDQFAVHDRDWVGHVTKPLKLSQGPFISGHVAFPGLYGTPSRAAPASGVPTMCPGDRRANRIRSLTSLPQRLVKTGGRLIKHAGYYWLVVAESHLTRRLFGATLRRIAALPPAG
jgi:hypothetical protein